MSRYVDRSKPLSDEDRRYLLNHGEDGLVAILDERFPDAVPEEPMTPDLETGFTGDGTREVATPGVPPEESDDDTGDDGDADEVAPYEEWSAEDLRAEIDERNENRETKISKAGGVAAMAARLRDDDAQASA